MVKKIFLLLILVSGILISGCANTYNFEENYDDSSNVGNSNLIKSEFNGIKFDSISSNWNGNELNLYFRYIGVQPISFEFIKNEIKVNSGSCSPISIENQNSDSNIFKNSFKGIIKLNCNLDSNENRIKGNFNLNKIISDNEEPFKIEFNLIKSKEVKNNLVENFDLVSSSYGYVEYNSTYFDINKELSKNNSGDNRVVVEYTHKTSKPKGTVINFNDISLENSNVSCNLETVLNQFNEFKTGQIENIRNGFDVKFIFNCGILKNNFEGNLKFKYFLNKNFNKGILFKDKILVKVN